MKKLFILILISTACSAGFAQGLFVGIEGGFTSIWIANQNNYGMQELDYSRTWGGAGGIAGGYYLNDNFGIQAEINFAHMGQDYFDVAKDFGPLVDGKPVKVDTYRFIDLNYLMVPVMFQSRTIKDKKTVVTFYGSAGPAFGFLMSADQSYEADTSYTNTAVPLDYTYAPESFVPEFASTSTVEDPKEYFSKVDVGLQMNLGVNIFLNDNVFFTPGFKIYYGLTDINSKPTRDIPKYNGASHNFFAGVFVGCHFNLGGD